MTFLVTVLSAAYPLLKKRILIKRKSNLVRTMVWVLGYTIKLFIMFLMMTMNVWVNLTLILGTAIGMVAF